MISISDARACILERTWTNLPTLVPLSEAVSLVLAKDVTCDADSPPHDKSLVDGFALRTSDLAAGRVELTVIERITAGELPVQPVRPGTTVQIMTGAPIPAGADAVVMFEQAVVDTATAPGRVCVDAGLVEPGQNIMRRGAAMLRGSVVLPAGHMVRPVDVGLLAEVGCCRVPVIEPPSVAVLATGNELIAADQVPQPGMIRNSNGPLLVALARSRHARVSDLGMCRDVAGELGGRIRQGLSHHVLVLSGGVSAGVLDLVPQVLEQLGVQKVFHKIELKPGKPLWFGVRQTDGRPCLVFGLPGNPVGSLVCFELLVAPALSKLRGLAHAPPNTWQANLAIAFHHSSDRPTYHPAYAEREGGEVKRVTPVSWQGSADQRALGSANCLVVFPPGDRTFEPGELVDVVMFPGEELS